MQLVAHLLIGGGRQADPVWLANPFEPRCDIDPVAHQIAVRLFDDVAQVDADTNVDALVGRHARVAFGEAALHLQRAPDSFDHAAKLDHRAVAGALDEPTVVDGDGGVDEVAAQGPQARKRPLLVSAGQPAIADDVGDQNRRDFPTLAHCAALRGPI